MKYDLIELYKAGLVSHKATFYIDVAEKKSSLMKTGLNNKQAEQKLAKDMKISERTVRRASKAKKRLDEVTDTK
ncbi:hypothetical protein KAR91_54070 [Candidatus Pacearchaeota archaeon]|nr:hypothetical protein [Candidatus Pacearchaeota archaeon]